MFLAPSSSYAQRPSSLNRPGGDLGSVKPSILAASNNSNLPLSPSDVNNNNNNRSSNKKKAPVAAPRSNHHANTQLQSSRLNKNNTLPSTDGGANTDSTQSSSKLYRQSVPTNQASSVSFISHKDSLEGILNPPSEHNHRSHTAEYSVESSEQISESGPAVQGGKGSLEDLVAIDEDVESDHYTIIPEEETTDNSSKHHHQYQQHLIQKTNVDRNQTNASSEASVDSAMIF